MVNNTLKKKSIFFLNVIETSRQTDAGGVLVRENILSKKELNNFEIFENIPPKNIFMKDDEQGRRSNKTIIIRIRLKTIANEIKKNFNLPAK